MKLDELTSMIEADSVIDSAELGQESLRIPVLHSKYYSILVTELRILRGMEAEYKNVKKERTDYYLGKADDEVYKAEPLNFKVIKAELDLYLDADQKLSVLDNKRALQRIKIDMLEAFIKTVNNRSFNIKNAIEWHKFRNGINA